MSIIYNVITLLRINVNYQNIFDVIRREKTLGKNYWQLLQVH